MTHLGWVFVCIQIDCLFCPEMRALSLRALGSWPASRAEFIIVPQSLSQRATRTGIAKCVLVLFNDYHIIMRKTTAATVARAQRKQMTFRCVFIIINGCAVKSRRLTRQNKGVNGGNLRAFHLVCRTVTS